MMQRKYFFLVSLLQVITVIVADVKVKFYLVQKTQWDAEKMDPTFRSVVSSEAQRYCTVKFLDCGLTESNQSVFKSDNVKYTDTFPKNDGNRYLDVSIGITNSQSKTLSNNVVQSILLAARENLNKNFSTIIVEIGPETFSPPPSDLANKIIIPIACVITAGLALAAALLSHWESKKNEKELRIQMKNHKKSYSSKVVPRPQINDRIDGRDIEKSQFNNGFNSSLTEQQLKPAPVENNPPSANNYFAAPSPAENSAIKYGSTPNAAGNAAPPMMLQQNISDLNSAALGAVTPPRPSTLPDVMAMPLPPPMAMKTLMGSPTEEKEVDQEKKKRRRRSKKVKDRSDSEEAMLMNSMLSTSDDGGHGSGPIQVDRKTSVEVPVSAAAASTDSAAVADAGVV